MTQVLVPAMNYLQNWLVHSIMVHLGELISSKVDKLGTRSWEPGDLIVQKIPRYTENEILVKEQIMTT